MKLFLLLATLFSLPAFADQLGTCYEGASCKGKVLKKDVSVFACNGESWRNAKTNVCFGITTSWIPLGGPIACRDGSQCPGSQKCVRSQCVDPEPPHDGTPQCQWNGDCSFPEGTCINGVCSR